jgi:adenylosuccinate lyase
MYSVFTEEAKLQSWLDVEVALACAHAELGTIPRSAAEEIERKATVGIVKVERVKQIEEKTRHDLFAMVYALQEVCKGDAGNYVHLGPTSSDIEDTALALQLKKAIIIIENDLKTLFKLLKQGKPHNHEIYINKANDPYTFTFWADEITRHLDRLNETRTRILVGKMSGAVGTMASFGEKGFEVQKLTLERLGLKPVLIANQIIQRDRHAELQSRLALIMGTMENIERKLYNMQGNETEIRGLSSIIRGFTIASIESIALEHERDISNSAVERIYIPETFILTDYTIQKIIEMIKEAYI